MQHLNVAFYALSDEHQDVKRVSPSFVYRVSAQSIEHVVSCTWTYGKMILHRERAVYVSTRGA